MLCFIHIERAGGTTLHHILRNNMLSFLTLKPFLWSNDPESVFTAGELQAMLRLLPFTKGFGGHNTRVYLGYERAARKPIQYFTFLRSPLERYMSHFHFQVDSMGVPWTFDSFVSEPRFANFMTTRIAGEPDLDRAKELLEKKFAFVGLTERFDESLLLMRHALGLGRFDIRYERQNSGRSGATDAGAGPDLTDPGVLSEARSQNLLDLELYEFARTQVFPRYLEQYGADRTTDLERFHLDNEGFRFRRGRRALWAMYRKFGYEPIEVAIRRWQGQPVALAA